MIKQFTTFSLLFCLLTVSAFSQQRIMTPVPDRVVTHPLPHNLISTRATMDTLIPNALGLACGDTVYSNPITDLWGFVGGTNEYGDTEKAQRYSFSEVSPFKVTETWVFFASASVVGDANISIKIYSVKSNGAPDVLLGTSDPVKASEILLDDQLVLPTSFTFSSPVLVEVPDFFVSVDFSESYNAQTDTIGIFMTGPNCGSGDDSWELFSTGDWYAINDQDSWRYNSDFWIFPIIEYEAPLNTTDAFVAKNGLQLFPAQPNPAYEQIGLPYELSNGTRVSIEIYAADGRLLRKIDKGQQGPGAYRENLSVADLPAGAYVYGIVTEEARIMSRFIVNH
ncbi:MAG: T9SS type A sorting domain-containing protein [Saprospiraceae bacterium]